MGKYIYILAGGGPRAFRASQVYLGIFYGDKVCVETELSELPTHRKSEKIRMSDRGGCKLGVKPVCEITDHREAIESSADEG